MSEPARLDALAALVHAMADECRVAAAQVDATRTVRWASPAGDRFRDRVGERAAALRACGEDLDAAAQAVRAHARAVQEPP